ncbi:MAG TPA: hypothetical protein VFS09_01255 [Candidatus Eisenbacteria bacterium]|nr:hypothetical protein [Candidatus Eisenbacteria bacterium]
MRHHRFRPGHRLAAVLLAVSAAISLPVAAPSFAQPPSVSPVPQATPSQLMAALERAWTAGDTNAIASLCDSATVKIALKPGTPPAAAPTMNAVAFLIHDQLDLVQSRRFQIVRLDTDEKKGTAKAWASWHGTWGGGKGARDIEVVLAARAAADGGWLLTEIRAND